MLKGIKVRIYPNKDQSSYLSNLLGSCRFVYNQCLAYEKEHNDKASLSLFSSYFHNVLRKDNEWLQEHNTKVVKQSIIDLMTAFKNKKEHNRGYPNFKKRSNEQKVRFPLEAISNKTFNSDASRFNLTKTLKDLKFECSDRDRKYLIKHKDNIKSISITKTKTDKYFASFLVDGDLNKEIKDTNKCVGIDLGIKTLAAFSDGTTIENPKWIRKNEKQLKRLHKQLSKKQLKSNNRNKARLKLARKHEKIHNQKLDFLHNLTTKIINENQVIVLEDLNVKGMMKNHKLTKSIQELSLFEFRRQLEYKAKWHNRDLVFVDRFYPSSKTCSACGHINHDLTLKDRDYICPDCGNIIDRDLNASINILNEGLRIYNDNKDRPKDLS